MNVRAIQTLRRNLAAGKPVYGLWIALESASIAEIAVALGLDWIVIDAEHGHLDWGDIAGHVRASVRSETVALVRLAEPNAGLIKRALDIGADGVVLPWVESADQLRQAVAYARYPPAGKRGMGAERATGWGRGLAQHAREANEHVLVVPIIETVEGGRNIEAICQVPGVEILQLGPADYSSSAGYPGQWEGPGVAEQLLAIKDTIRRHGKHCGVVATNDDNLLQRLEQGFRFLGLGFDAGLMIRSLSASLGCVGRTATITPDFTPASLGSSEVDTTPDRAEAIQRVEAAACISLARGATLRPLVGSHNRARNLFTGLVTVEPEAEIPNYARPFGEALTLLAGEACAVVEDRRYTLRPLDCLYIPGGLPRKVVNTSSEQVAELHVAMAAESPIQTEVNVASAKSDAPGCGSSHSHAEFISRTESGECFELAPGAIFQDFFNARLGARGICGGYGVFQPGARLPCHRHEFDESITIVQGSATCLVEGRRYELSGNATALVPRGRCHYFINHSREPMAMVWVYAGDMPDRIVVDECRCHPPGAGD